MDGSDDNEEDESGDEDADTDSVTANKKPSSKPVPKLRSTLGKRKAESNPRKPKREYSVPFRC